MARTPSVGSTVVLVAMLAFLGGPAAAQQREAAGDAPDTTEQQDPRAQFTKLTKDAVHRPGYFDTWEKDGHLYLAVPRGRLGEDFLINFQIARGIGSSRVFGGTMLNIFEGSIVALEQHDDRLYLVQRPHRYTADAGTPAARAVDLTFSSSVLESAKIEAWSPDSAAVIDIYDWVVSDLSDISGRLRFAVSDNNRPGRVNFDKGRSYLEGVKAFPGNVNIRAKLTFRPGEPTNVRGVPDSRFIPVTIHYGLVQLPERPMAPRRADDRVGYFMTVHKNFSRQDSTFFSRFVNRWRLEPGRRVGDLVEPREPIVYYIDHTVPREYREAMKAGVEAWNEAFEAAGWRNAIRAEDLPEDADPEDIRYHTLRWNVSDVPGYGAIGPSIVDPRTGEILDADILFENNMVLGWKGFWRAHVSPVTALEEMFGAPESELTMLAQGGEMASFANELSAQGSLLRAALLARGDLRPNQPVPDSYIAEAMKWVTMHEVGHTLGLRHNFRASEDTPLERLHDREFARRYGVFNSAMEYPTVNVSAEGEPQGYFYNPTVGSYDRWAISFGYTHDPKQAAEIARRGALDGHAYGTDEDARGAGAIDPHISVYDLSDNPLAWGRQRADLIRGIWAELPSVTLTDNSRYADLTDAFNALLGQYARAVAVGIKYVGGQHQYRDHMGDPQARPPFTAVPRERQQEAMTFLTTYVFEENAFRIPPDVFQQFGADRWSHWGNQNTWGGRIDYPLQRQVVEIQTRLLSQLTHPFVFQKMLDAELKFGEGNVLTVPAMLEQLTAAVWSEVRQTRNVPQLRRDLQRAHLERLIDYVDEPPETLPADAASVARMQLARLGEAIERSLATQGLNDYTRAHLMEAQALIAKALDVD